MCKEIEKMKKEERIKIAKRILASEKFNYEELAYFTIEYIRIAYKQGIIDAFSILRETL